MTLMEYIKSYIDKNFNKHLEENKQAIIDYFNNNPDKISIVTKGYGFEDVIRISENGFKEEDKVVEVNDNGVLSRSTNSNFIRFIIDNLPRNVKELEIPLEVFKKLKLSEFKNLEKVKLGENIDLNKETLEQLRGLTKTREIVLPVEENNFLIDDGAIQYISSYSKKLYTYKDLTIKDPKFESNDKLTVICNNPYEKIDDIFKNINNDNTFSIIKKEKGKEANKSNSSWNEDILIRYEQKKDNNNKYMQISFNKFNNIADIIKILNNAENKELKIDKIIILLENKDYDDIESIKKIEEKYNTVLEYNREIKTVVSLDDFIAMRATLNYYKELIQQSNLSPLETVLYTYDLIKSYEYKEVDKGEEKEVSRNIHSIIREGKIVCVGYSEFLSQLLKELNIDCIKISTMVPLKDGTLAAHARNIINIKDDKYGIDGSFALDATWDSAKNLKKVITGDGEERIRAEEKLEDTDTIVKEYDNLSLYSHFLIPMSKYQEVFVGERMPKIDSYIDSSTPKDQIATINNIKESIDSYKGLDTKTLLELIANVRIKEGYSKEQTINSIKEIVEIQEYLKKQNEKKEEETEEVVIKK